MPRKRNWNPPAEKAKTAEPKLKQARIPQTIKPEDARLIQLAEAFLEAKGDEKDAKDRFNGAAEALLHEMSNRHRKSLRVGKVNITIAQVMKPKVAICKEEEPEPEPVKEAPKKDEKAKEEAKEPAKATA